ncbi:MAG: hypothetical protein HY000_02265 [Planctomycetes bacterium]|nr:hypothetical protein [Planctomycetota bacterium]
MVSAGMSAPYRLVALASLCLLAGCGREYSGERRYPLSGTVRVDAQPIEAGAISFIPIDYDKQRVSGGPITNGVYSVEEPRGANGGQYRVEIRWYKKTGRLVRDPLTGDLYEERKEGLPEHYHQESELTAEVSPGRTTFDFDLKSQ